MLGICNCQPTKQVEIRKFFEFVRFDVPRFPWPRIVYEALGTARVVCLVLREQYGRCGSFDAFLMGEKKGVIYVAAIQVANALRHYRRM